MQALRNYAHVVTILRSEEARSSSFNRKRSNVLCQRIAGREASFSQSSSNRRKSAAAIFRCSLYVHRRDTRIRLDTTTRSTGRSAVSPLSKNAGAMPILADGKSAWTQGGSASSHDSSSPIFTPFLPLSVRPVLFPIPDVTLTRRVKLKADESLSTWETIQIFCNDSRQWFSVPE